MIVVYYYFHLELLHQWFLSVKSIEGMSAMSFTIEINNIFVGSVT